MKVKTLSKEALKKISENLSSKKEDENSEEVLKDQLEETEGSQTEETLEDQLEENLENENSEDFKAKYLELQENLTAVEAENVDLKAKLEAMEAELATSKETAEGSEKLVTNLSENLRSVVNSMKITMGHVELGENVSGEALLKEYEFTSTKFMETLPTGSVVDEPKSKSKQTNQSAVTTLAASADYKHMPWSK